MAQLGGTAAQCEVGLDEGLLSLSLSGLLYMANLYSHWRITARPRVSTQGADFGGSELECLDSVGACSHGASFCKVLRAESIQKVRENDSTAHVEARAPSTARPTGASRRGQAATPRRGSTRARRRTSTAAARWRTWWSRPRPRSRWRTTAPSAATTPGQRRPHFLCPMASLCFFRGRAV